MVIAAPSLFLFTIVLLPSSIQPETFNAVSTTSPSPAAGKILH